MAMTTNNQRSFFRLSFNHPLCAEFKLIGEATDDAMKQSKIAILDISAGGTKFISTIDFTDELHSLFEIKFMALGKPYKLLGQLLRCRTIHAGIYECSSRFSITEAEENALTSVLNNIAIKMRKAKSLTLTNCSFCTQEELAEFHIRL
jgi:hypothetical protein